MTNELNIQKFLRTEDNAIQRLQDELALKISSDGVYTIFNYNQIDSPKNHPITNECRGLILDNENWDVVAFPFKRFFNYSELEEHSKLNLSEFQAQEKADGSMMNVWYDFKKNEWQVSTRSVLYGDAPIGNITDTTFRDLFWGVFDKSLLAGHENYNFVFELCTRQNRVVKRYPDDRVYLIGARARDKMHLEFGQLMLNNFAEALKVYRPQKYSFGSISDIFDYVKTLHEEDEGYVIFKENHDASESILVFADYYRIKLKNPAYVAIHHLKTNLNSLKNIVVLTIGKGEAAEFTAYFPEYTGIAETVMTEFDSFIVDQENIWKELEEANLATQKEKALFITSRTKNSAWLFRNTHRGYVPARKFYTDIAFESPDRLIDMLHLKTKITL